MPVFSTHTEPSKARSHPVLGSYKAWNLGDPAGLTQFGAYVECLEPGAVTSLRHWHENEDELVFMLSGEMVVYEGDKVTTIGAGQGAAFPAGAPAGHYLRNESTAPATFLTIGTRSENEVVTYPRHDRILVRNRDATNFTNLSGAPEDTNPYELVSNGDLSIEGKL